MEDSEERNWVEKYEDTEVNEEHKFSRECEVLRNISNLSLGVK